MDLYACGSNSEGQLGIGHTQDVGAWTRCTDGERAFPPHGWMVVEIASSATGTLALCERGGDRELWTCGRAWPGRDTSAFARVDTLELGITGRLVHVAAVWDCVYVVERVSEGDQIWALGASNAFGQWGTGPSPAQRAPAWRHRVDVRCMPDADAGPWRVHAIAGGVRHVLAVLTSAHAHWLVGWGHARHGQLGPLDARVVHAPQALLCLWRAGAHAPPTHALALGMAHSVVTVQQHGATRVYLWGSNKHGQLDMPGWAWDECGSTAQHATVPQTVVPACMWRTTLLHVEGRVQAHGADLHAQTRADGWTCHGTLCAGSEHALLLDVQGAAMGQVGSG
ncbi:hypothetical protein MCAP1_001431 [Malassezia caprae]|uniref:Uncharacterized protein n=1 Tax=Malassezia caprae TaxID=1381934 RepID=A0AAF0IW52_9BASI|nr:hypothetical protein MCAP1_001431 [Malassezia caprae]